MEHDNAVLEAPELEAPATPEPSLRETISKAFEVHPEESPTSTPAGKSTDEPGQVSGKDSVKPVADNTGPAADTKLAVKSGDQTGATGTPADKQGTQPGTELKAPSQWKPQAREQWNKLPLEVQQEVLRRENDNLKLIGSVGQKLKVANEIEAHLAPFQETLRTSGASPQAFVNDVFTTVRTLAAGPQEAKAETVANIIQAYGIDVRLLDQILTHRIQMPREVHQARQLAARAQAVIEQQNHTQQSQVETSAMNDLQAFGADPKNEFFTDVRGLMGDLISSGQAKDLPEAYSAAIWAHPDTRKILLQREAEARVAVKNKRATAARTASSSIHGSTPVVGGSQENPDASLRQTLEEAFDEHS